MAKIETVCGPIRPKGLGITLPHEHILVDIAEVWMKRLREEYSKPLDDSQMRYLDEPVTMEILGKLRRGEIVCKDDMRLNNAQLAADELMEFKRGGGKSIVEQSMPGIGRDPLTLRQISIETGLHIIAVTGFYIWASHPSYVKKMNVEQLSEIMKKEIEEGIGGTDVKAGAIGECACTEPVPWHPEERKVLQAAFRAQRQTGVGFTLHPSAYDTKQRVAVKTAEKYLDLMETEGADRTKFYLSHSDYTCFDLDYHRRLLESGITLSYDTFGMDVYYDYFQYVGARSPTDCERVKGIVELCKQGYDKQLMLSQDVCCKQFLKRYGGYGYSHILEHIVPTLRAEGVTERQIHNMLIDNPTRILTF